LGVVKFQAVLYYFAEASQILGVHSEINPLTGYIGFDCQSVMQTTVKKKSLSPLVNVASFLFSGSKNSMSCL